MLSTVTHNLIIGVTCLLFLVPVARGIDWPVFFEQLGQVHSIHNKWDLALRVQIDLPSTDAQISKILHKLDLLDSSFDDAKARGTRSRSRGGLTRLEDLERSWKEQNLKLSARCENLQRRSGDLQEMGQHTLRAKRSAAAPVEKETAGHPLLHSRSKRQNNVNSGILQGLFGVAYTNDVEQVKSTLTNLDSRLSSDLNVVKTQAVNLRSSTSDQIRSQSRELQKMEDIADTLERKVSITQTNINA